MPEEIRDPDCPPGVIYLLDPAYIWTQDESGESGEWTQPWLVVGDGEQSTVVTEQILLDAVERIEREGR